MNIAKSLLASSAVLLMAGCAHHGGAAAGGGAATIAGSPPHPAVRFSTGRSSVRREDIFKVMENAAWLSGQAGAQLVLAGHCDERGGKAMNLELGDRRARAVKAALMRAGVEDEARLVVVSFGEEKPLDAGHDESAWRKNRRVEFIAR
ncbi:MAG TPA: OmpA family protein [bacterium]|nr:OmpA family protein [bacterium]